MAGSGKTTLLQRLSSHLHTTQTPGYIINLDPAVTQVPYGANIDIRDTVRLAEAVGTVNLAAVQQSSKLRLACSGELQECDETVRSGSKWWHPDITQPVCNQIRSGMLSSQPRMVTPTTFAYLVASIIRVNLQLRVSASLAVGGSCDLLAADSDAHGACLVR